MKKKTLLAGLATIGASVMALCACNATDGGYALTKSEDVYGLGAVTTVRLLGSEVSGAAVERLTAVSALDGRATVARSAVLCDQKTESEESTEWNRTEQGGEEFSEDLSTETDLTDSLTDGDAADPSTDVGAGSDENAKAQIEKFNEYFNALDCFLGEDVVQTTAVENPDTDGAYGAYAVKLTVTGKNMRGEDVVHLMYYTETLVKEKNKDDESESEYVLEGVMIVDGADYLLKGERSVEIDGKETENEIKIRAYSASDEGTYVEMSQEYSEEQGETEKEYVYRVTVDHQLVEETAIKFENESKGEKQETEFSLEFRQGDSKGAYKIEREIKNGETEMKVKYRIDGESGSFRIRKIEVNGEEVTEYVFSDNTTKTFRSGKN